MALHQAFFSPFLFSSTRLPSLHSPKNPPTPCIFKTKRCVATTLTNDHDPTVTRRPANYKPTVWDYNFVQSLGSGYTEEKYTRQADEMKSEVKRLLNAVMDPLARLELIDAVQRLGLTYHFEIEIKKTLDIVYNDRNDNQWFCDDLHATALRFRLLRQHGYNAPQDVFRNFKDHNGDFMSSLCKEVKGMLSLYEASYFAFEGENLLDEAKAFTSIHLKDIERNRDTSIAEQGSHALELPLHHRMQRLEARWYIEAYQKTEDVNRVLLELAKLDFNIVQSTIQRDLKDMSRWWKGMGLANKLSFSRDRLMECFFWSVGMVSEPQLHNCRRWLTKVAALITTIDDIYDVYGSLDELEIFTDAVERWDVHGMRNLPDYMKICFLALYNTVNEMAYDILKEKGEDSIPYLTKAWADLCKAFLLEAKWQYTKHMPTLADYLDNAWLSVSGVVLLVHAYFVTSENITEEALDCLQNCHDLLRFPSTIFQLCNDLVTSTAELERGETTNSITCYMHETGHSEELAREHISNLIDKTWKKMNKVIVADSPFPKPFIETAINLARIAQCTYQYGDGHGAPDIRSKNRILSVIIDPV